MPSRMFVLLLLVTVTACSGPFLVIPGGKLDGDVKPVPADWGFADQTGTVQLETRAEDPYSVNIVYFVVDGHLYINAGDTETQWVKNMADNPEVRLRLSGSVYELRSERVRDEAEIAKFGEVWASSSMFLRNPADLEQVWVYRLVRR